MAKKAALDDFELNESSSFVSPGQFLGEEPAQTGDDQEDEEEEQEEQEEEGTPRFTPEVEEQEDEEQKEEQEDDEFSFAPIAADFLEEGVWELPEGKTLEDYDDSPEGMREMAKDAGHAQLLKTVASLPDTAQKIMALALKGNATEEDLQALLTLEDGPNWEEADLEDEDVQRAIAEEAMRLREPEISEEEVAEAIQDLIDIGKLDKQAAKDQKYLIRAQEADKAAVELAVEERAKAAEKAYKEEITFVENFITEAKEIGGLPVTKKDREDFMNFLTVKGKDGLTQSERMNTMERRIKKEYLNFKDFNLGKLKREAVTEATKDIKKQLARYNSGSRPTNTGNRPVTKDIQGTFMSPSQFLAAQE